MKESDSLSKKAENYRWSKIRLALWIVVPILAISTLTFTDPLLKVSPYSPFNGSPFTGGAGPAESYRILSINRKIGKSRPLNGGEWTDLLKATSHPVVGLRSSAAANLFILYKTASKLQKTEIKQTLLALTADPEPFMRSLAYSQLILHCHVPESPSLLKRELTDEDEFVRQYAVKHREYLARLRKGTPATSVAKKIPTTSLGRS